MARIFISYRRDDSGYAASIVRNHLESEFGAGSVFMDIDNIPLGVDFRTHLSDAVATCDVLIALIGETWTGALPGRTERRIDDAKDFVRIEVEAALQRGIPVVPVLVDKAQLPAADALPESLRELMFRNAAEVRAGRDQAAQLAALAKGLHQHLDRASAPAARAGATAAAPTPAEKLRPTTSGDPMSRSPSTAPGTAGLRQEPTTGSPPSRRLPGWWLAALAAGLVAAAAWFVVARSGDSSTSAANAERAATTAPAIAAPKVQDVSAAAAPAPAALDAALFDGYTIAIYYPEGDAAAGNTARAIQADLAAQGLRRGVQVRAATADFLRSVVPPETLEVRYEEGIETAQAQGLVAALAAGPGARRAKLLPVERRTANFLSVFVPAGG
jgi:hypothetical protein